jgi:signal transduction histidine kinase
VNKETEHLIKGYSMGAVDYVFKPVEPVVLRSKVAVFVDLFTMTREIQRKARQEQQLLDANLKANAERLRIEQELRVAEQRQAAIILSLPIILYLEDLEASPRLPQFVGGNFAAVTGFEFEDVLATPTIWADRLHPDDRERVFGALAARRQSGSMAIEYRWQCADGSYKHFLDQAVLLRDVRGRPSQYAGQPARRHRPQGSRKPARPGAQDGRDRQAHRRHRARFQQSSRCRPRWSRPHRAAPSAGGRASQDPGDDPACGEQGSELVRRLLAFCARQQLEPAAIGIDNLSANVTNLLAHTLGGLVELDWQTEDGLWSAYADEAQLELALMNLIINARDAMPDGGRISVLCENHEIGPGSDLGLARGEYVVLAVTDSGCGIAPEILEQVLEPFFTTKDVGKGTGLGLSMVYGFARQSGGTLNIRSKVDEGTRAEIWLPRAPEALEARIGRAAEIAAPAKGGRELNILLVDDHEGVRATTAALLEDLGHSVRQAADGESMLAMLQKDPEAVDLIISDYAMPLVSGAEAVHRARAISPNVPGIIITGYADAQSISRRPEDVIVLRKPFTPEQLACAIRSVCPAPDDAIAAA